MLWTLVAVKLRRSRSVFVGYDLLNVVFLTIARVVWFFGIKKPASLTNRVFSCGLWNHGETVIHNRHSGGTNFVNPGTAEIVCHIDEESFTSVSRYGSHTFAIGDGQ